ncbi:MAG: hydroxyneurosporene methyltransferase [Alphaproteobacteria bacterium]|nr:hydroxyneurosporene methyltransferase [Alphaproteobacteria bacterium]MCB9797273.1 hydroxyneurosporene methyltransferase [Alphaproteobacteria bacterium]
MSARAKQVFFGYIATQCVHTALELGVADALDAGPRSAEELAQALGAQPGPLSRVLDVLIRLGLFTRDEAGRYAHNEDSRCLSSAHESSMAELFRFCGRESYQALAGLPHAVRTGEPSFPLAWDKPFWQHLRDEPQRGALFGRAMERQSEHLLQQLARLVDFSAYPQIVDVGGGKGQLFRPLARAGVPLDAVVFDQPSLAPLAQGFLAEEGLQGVRFEGGDFFRAVPEGGDLYVLKFVLHDWDAPEALAILAKVKEAMKPGARLMIIELFKGASPSPWSFLSDMIMLSTFGAMERSEAEYRALLGAAGFSVQVTERVEGDHFYLLASPTA